MIIPMSAELIATIIGVAATIISLGITIGISAYLTNKTIRETTKETQKILREITCITSKVAVGMKASALMHGWKTVENVTDVSEIEKIAEEYEYDPNLKICYYKPRKSSV